MTDAARRLAAEFLPSRYPDVAGAAPYQLYDQAAADRCLACAQEIRAWTASQLGETL